MTNIVKCRKCLEDACELYWTWHNTGKPIMTASNISYELVTYINEALAELNTELDKEKNRGFFND